MHRLLSDIVDTDVDVTSTYSTIRKNDVGLSGWDAVNYLGGNVAITKAYVCHIRSILPASLTCIVLSTRGCSHWRPAACGHTR